MNYKKKKKNIILGAEVMEQDWSREAQSKGRRKKSFFLHVTRRGGGGLGYKGLVKICVFWKPQENQIIIQGVLHSLTSPSCPYTNLQL